MSKLYLTTFQAAELLSVTPDSILKWIKSGKLLARKTPGGHHRISRENIDALLQQNQNQAPSPDRYNVYCWEHNAQNIECTDNCKDCLVYKARAKHCFELGDFPRESGFLKRFCSSSCENCEYYEMIKKHN